MAVQGDKFKLKDKFENIIRQARQGKSVSDEIRNLRATIENAMEELSREDNLRVFEGEKGGALRGPIDNRTTYENDGSLYCHERYLTHSKNDTPTEVPYMRALFNSRRLSGYNLIGYESPLMRKRRRAERIPEVVGRESQIGRTDLCQQPAAPHGGDRQRRILPCQQHQMHAPGGMRQKLIQQVVYGGPSLNAVIIIQYEVERLGYLMQIIQQMARQVCSRGHL